MKHTHTKLKPVNNTATYTKRILLVFIIVNQTFVLVKSLSLNPVFVITAVRHYTGLVAVTQTERMTGTGRVVVEAGRGRPATVADTALLMQMLSVPQRRLTKKQQKQCEHRVSGCVRSVQQLTEA